MEPHERPDPDSPNRPLRDVSGYRQAATWALRRVSASAIGQRVETAAEGKAEIMACKGGFVSGPCPSMGRRPIASRRGNW